MAVQTDYNVTHASKYAGMVVRASGMPTAIFSRVNTDSANLGFGTGITRDGKAPTSSTTAADFGGVVKLNHNFALEDGAVSGAVVDQSFDAVTMGVIAVELLDTVTAGSPAFWRVGATGTGKFSGVEGTGATLGVAIPDTVFLEAGVAGDIVNLSLKVGG